VFFKISSSPALERIASRLTAGDSLLLEKLWNSPKALIAAIAAQSTGKNILILTGASIEEVRLYHDFKVFSDLPVLDFPAWETLPSENIPPSPDIVGDRYQTLHQIYKSKTPHIVISSLQACLQKLLPPKRFEGLRFYCEVGKPLNFQKTIDRFLEIGYKKSLVASDKGEFAVRGGIIDVYPVSLPDPYRLEFWGDELESLRTYDPIGQKSVKAVQSLEIMPGQELELVQKEPILSSILDYLGENTLLIFDDLLALEDRYTSLLQFTGTGPSFYSMDALLDLMKPFQKIYLSAQPIEELSEIPGIIPGYYSASSLPQEIEFELFNRKLSAARIPSPFKTLQDALLPEIEEEYSGAELLSSLDMLPKDTFQVYFLCDSDAEKIKLQGQVSDLSLHLPRHTYYLDGYLSSGFVLSDAEMLVLPFTELTGRYKIRRQKQRSAYHTSYVEVNDLQPGDLVVHFHQGIGKFLGIEKQKNHLGVESEFFLVEYAEGGKLFVPIQQAYLVNKYIGSQDDSPKLHTIGGTRWKKTKEQTQAAILGYASDLLNLYAARELKGGFSFKEDSPDMRNFEEEFPFVETEDQLAAIRDIKTDMNSQKAMDRLVCGDVGYGKTEVAMRAAFKAVVDGEKQVAVLVPTTVLAMQHFDNFIERMSNFPVRIGVLSRFRSPKEIRQTLKGLEEGSIDIVIGTHRVVSKDVIFKDLGLIIIDEEQRFGVKAKEHLKKIKTGVDCLTLSATPIPRTLYMSLMGAREMSIISSPPQDRLPIKTVIAEPDPQLVKNALMRELARDGQVYFIHNRVDTIFEVAAKLKEMAPHARIVVGHGQMHADELDSVFHAFKSGAADILVATTIVENGIDIPNANTILIDRCDRFGLADLYQLRGRVGRWNRRAYAYFLVPKLRSLPELSRKRLDALAESSGYGGGMKLAMRDLEIRGAGDMLGISQSGHVASVGFHLYCKMLQRTIKTLQGKLPQMLSDVKIEISVDARLPDTYIEDVSLRMEIYQRFGDAMTLEDADDIWSEVKDRFGKPPEPALWLYHMTRLKIFAQMNGYTHIKMEKFTLRTERIKGKQTISRSVLIPSFKKPQDISDKILPLLKEG
jgi:transcription-repair coupling factor (superfamily II helicase)